MAGYKEVYSGAISGPGVYGLKDTGFGGPKAVGFHVEPTGPFKMVLRVEHSAMGLVWFPLATFQPATDHVQCIHRDPSPSFPFLRVRVVSHEGAPCTCTVWSSVFG